MIVDEKELPEQLHKWYLEAIQKIHPDSFNPKANCSFSDLTPDQKYIDFYIAGKIVALLNSIKQEREGVNDNTDI